MGLHLVKQIAETYGGRVQLKDSDLGGARFDTYLQKSTEEQKKNEDPNEK